ncbi:MAG TPA: VWA domain-containing protein, partial [Cytophagaceae bacterium]|nr:VWA domain-containing protein [Cytophagaceae bacterium]
PINNEYQLDIDGVENFDFVDLPNRKLTIIEKTITYEPTNIKEIIKNDTITQTLMPGQGGTSGRALTILIAQDRKGTPCVNEVIYLQMLKDKRVYTARTNKDGKAEFLLPKGKKYMIHFRYKKDVDVIDLSRSFGIGYKSKSVIYTPSDKLQHPEKYIPKPEAIFTDQFFNFINKQFERPKEGEGVIAYARWGGDINANSKQAVLQLTFTSETPPDHTIGPPLNICLVIDKSGSMAGYDRIDKLKLALIEYINKLRPDDIISIIAFDNYQKIVLPAQKVGIDKKQIKDAIERIYADGGTNIYKGLVYGYQEVLKNYRKGLVNRVVLLSDGYGSDDVDSTIFMSKSYNAKGVECSAVGVGNDYNYPMLKSLASSGGGLIHFVGDDDSMTKAFLEDLSSVLVPVAKNVKVEVTYNKHLLFAQLMGYPLEQKSDGKINFKIKNFFSGLDQMAMVKFTLIDPTKDIENIPVTITLRYTDARTNKPIEKITTAPLKWSETTGELEYLLDLDQKKLYATAVMNQSLKVMAEAFQVGDRTSAKAALENCMAEMKKIYPQATEGQVNILMEQMQEYLEILNTIK